jgi:hypothetical protein
VRNGRKWAWRRQANGRATSSTTGQVDHKASVPQSRTLALAGGGAMIVMGTPELIHSMSVVCGVLPTELV